MTAYEQKRAEMFARSQAREEEKRQEFLSKVNQVIINRDSFKHYIKKLIETKKGYVDYTITKHQTGIYTYRVTFYDSNRYSTRSTEYFYNDIPKTHKAQFEALEQLFQLK